MSSGKLFCNGLFEFEKRPVQTFCQLRNKIARTLQLLLTALLTILHPTFPEMSVCLMLYIRINERRRIYERKNVTGSIISNGYHGDHVNLFNVPFS